MESLNNKNSPKVIVFSNQKGGVGKTTTTVSIAATLAQKGYKTLLIDIDPQGNATTGVGIDKKCQEKTIYQCLHEFIPIDQAILKTDFENLYLIPSNSHLAGSEIELTAFERREFVLSKILSTLKTEFDFVLIDCPPSLGLLTVNALVAAQQLFIPLQCEYYSLEALGDLLGTFTLIKNNLNPKIEIGGVILTMADFRANMTIQVIEEVRNYFGDKVFKAIVPRSIRVAEAPSHGKPIAYYDAFSKGGKAYLEIADEFLERENLPKEKNQKSTNLTAELKSEKSIEEVSAS